MKLSISEARKRLPALVHMIQQDTGTRIQITVHGQVVAELRAVHRNLRREPRPGHSST